MRILEYEIVSPAFHRDFLSYLAAISKKKTISPKCGSFKKATHLLSHHFSFPESECGFPRSSRQGSIEGVLRVLLGFPPRLMSTAVKEEPPALIHVRLCTRLTYNPGCLLSLRIIREMGAPRHM